MNIVIALIVGFILGWLVEWVIDWLFWRRPQTGPGSYADLQDQQQSLMSAHNETQGCLQQQQHENDSLRVQLENARSDIGNRDHEITMFRGVGQSQATGASAELDTVKGERDAAQHEISGLMGKVSQLEAEVQAQAKANKAASGDEELAQLRAKEQRTREQLVLVQGDRDKAKQNEGLVVAERDKLEAELKALRENGGVTESADASKYDAEISRLKGRLEEERNRADAAVEANAQSVALQTKVGELEKDLAAKSADCKQCEEALAVAKADQGGSGGIMGLVGNTDAEKPAEQPKPKGVIKPKNENDLKFVKGIGPKIEQLLHAAGITTFVELSKTPADKIKSILHDAGERYQLAEPATWPEQAALAAAGRWTDLHELQATIDRY